jgi:hypothetical protein
MKPVSKLFSSNHNFHTSTQKSYEKNFIVMEKDRNPPEKKVHKPFLPLQRTHYHFHQQAVAHNAGEVALL